MTSVSLHWFINDLRLADNPAFSRAAMAERLLCVYVIDPRCFRPGRQQIASLGEKRRLFLWQSLAELDRRLQALGQQLLVLEGHPASVISGLIQRHRVTRLTVNEVCTIDECHQLALVENAHPGLRVDVFPGNQLLSPARWQQKKLPRVFSEFRAVLGPLDCRPVMAAPPSLPPSPAQPAPITRASLLSFGRQSVAGGESAGQARLARVFSGQLPRSYKQTRDALDQADASTGLSPWLAAGCISPVQVWWRLKHWQDQHGVCESSDWIAFELLWREFFHHLARELGAKLFRFGGIKGRRPLTSFYPLAFKAWCSGTTAEPLVNAIMNQLRSTGFISNRARQIAASYLVNELNLDWRYGAAWFEHHLLDYDAAVNWGNWQYIAGVGADPRGGRHFNVDRQRERFDPDGEYIARWDGEKSVIPMTGNYVGWP